ncbi:MAG: hypothetical protein K2O17_07365 [Bacteroidaceae bacterium]|nr:hypothetical protein [Bacteroidaceae bacterium]
MCGKNDYKLSFYDSLESLYDLYDKVRQAIILVENFDKGRNMYIAPINQLRSVLDHIFKAVSHAEDQERSAYELKEAKEHLDRAGYDALELLAAYLGIAIVEKVAQYDNETLTTIFPEYFTIIKPQITDIKNKVATLRSKKDLNSEISFSAYFDQITKLIEMDKRVDVMIPSLEEFTQRSKRSQQIRSAIWLVATVATAIISGLIGYLFRN